MIVSWDSQFDAPSPRVALVLVLEEKGSDVANTDVDAHERAWQIVGVAAHLAAESSGRWSVSEVEARSQVEFPPELAITLAHDDCNLLGHRLPRVAPQVLDEAAAPTNSVDEGGMERLSRARWELRQDLFEVLAHVLRVRAVRHTGAVRHLLAFAPDLIDEEVEGGAVLILLCPLDVLLMRCSTVSEAARSTREKPRPIRESMFS